MCNVIKGVIYIFIIKNIISVFMCKMFKIYHDRGLYACLKSNLIPFVRGLPHLLCILLQLLKTFTYFIQVMGKLLGENFFFIIPIQLI